MKTAKQIVILITFITIAVNSQQKENFLYKNAESISGEPSEYKFNINNISTYIYADGRMDVDGGNSGFEFPKGSNKFCFYETGFIWGGFDEDSTLKLGGSTFPSGLVHGKVGQSPEEARMYRVRPDWQNGSMASEIADNEMDGEEAFIRAQYKKDWLEWPWQDGAPYLDADGNGKYEPDPDRNGSYDPGEDIPGYPGAAQTIYFIANNSDENKSRQFYGSPPTNFEMRVTVWGYNFATILSNIVFKEYVIINKDKQSYRDMYFGIWCDPDVGNAGDDFVGCDTLLNLGYAYNATNNDTQYGSFPPACGHVLLSINKIVTKITSFDYFVNESIPYWTEPPEPNIWTFYNSLCGLNSFTGEPYLIPPSVGTGITKFPLSGDPVSGHGWVDGIVKKPMDRRYMIGVGPYNLSSNDTIRICLAQIVAQGENRLSSITKLKECAEFAIGAAQGGFDIPRIPPIPNVKVYEGDEEIILNWGDKSSVDNLEDGESGGFEFQGYNIYQLPLPYMNNAEIKKIATYDIKDDIFIIYKTVIDESGIELKVIDQFGSNDGIERYHRITKNEFQDTKLFNGTSYYFAVTAYTYSKNFWENANSMESPIAIIQAVPHKQNPGSINVNRFGDKLSVAHLNGNSDAEVNVTIIDPSLLKTSSYDIIFSTHEGELVWSLANSETDSVLLEQQSNYYPSDKYYITNGFKVIIKDPNGSLTANDVYRFSVIGEAYNSVKAQEDIDKINVFPNPYYGANPNELNKYQRYVTFSHLPEEATIRIFNLAGELVRTIYKTEPGQFQRWDLMNEHGWQAPAGIYIAYIEMPQLGKIKLLKLAIIPERIVPDYY